MRVATAVLAIGLAIVVASTAQAQQPSPGTTRIADGSWPVDVRLGNGVTLETATTIVRALRRKAWVDMRPADEQARDSTRGPFESLSGFDPDEIISIDRDSRDAAAYTVRTGRGPADLSLGVRLGRDGRVEIHRVGGWVA